MSFHDNHFPWLFHRDEVDLLEDELEDLYAKFACDPQETPLTVEAGILREQWETEEFSDAELTLKLGLGMLRERQAPDSSVEMSQDEVGEEEAFVQSIRQHPLYQSARLWAALIRDLAKAGYERQTHASRHFFRAYANVNLVPIKIFTALAEESCDDPLGQTVAEESYVLALIYLDRVRRSLSAILHSVEDAQSVQRLQSRGSLLQEAIEQQLIFLRRRNKKL